MVVRPAILDVDAQVFIEMTRRYLNPAADPDRYQWLYRSCPLGSPRAWVAEDVHGVPMGIAAAFPRRVYFRGTPWPAWVLGDFCITEAHRSLGPALSLQRACLDGVGEAGSAVYDLPGLAMLSVYRRLRVRPVWCLRRFVRPLNLRERLPRSFPQPLAHALGRLVDFVLARFQPGLPAALEIRAQTQPCGSEFTALAATLGAAYGFCVDRSADYLTWRYLQTAHHPYRMLAARRSGELLGYVVIRHRSPLLEIVDLFGLPDERVAWALLGAVLEIGRALDVTAVCVTTAESHPWLPQLRRCGFWPRERHPVVLLLDGQPVAPTPGEAWLLTEGDRES